MVRPAGWILLFVFTAVAAALVLPVAAARPADSAPPGSPFHVRRLLYRELQPVALANCQLQRVGEANDGGYLVCGNLLQRVESAYSYGISGYDGWGCEISTRLSVPVHEYDCFNLERPLCPTGLPVFHGECIGTTKTTEEGRPFDTLANQMGRNGDRGKRVIVKMDVEGAEWNSFLTAPDEVLQRIDQLVVEFHGTGEPRYLAAMKRLRRYFHVAHLHWNNYACVDDQAPFRSWAYEVLLVNKRIGIVASRLAAAGEPAQPLTPDALDAPNDPTRPDCGAGPAPE